MPCTNVQYYNNLPWLGRPLFPTPPHASHGVDGVKRQQKHGGNGVAGQPAIGCGVALFSVLSLFCAGAFLALRTVAVRGCCHPRGWPGF